MSVKLSVTIITLNEEKNIGQCLEAARLVADEIVVVDSYSTDRTREICESYGARFIENVFEGHIQQKNFAVEQATYDHVLSLDADEILSEQLADSINAVKDNWQKDAYYLLRRSFYCGKFINHGDWYPDRKIRLFKKSSGRWAGMNPHDTYTIFNDKTLGKLKGDLEHYTFNTVWAHVEQANKFSSIGARELIKAQTKVSIFTLFLHPFWRFFRSYILRLGFMDGLRGYAIASIIGIETFLKYLKVIWPVDKFPFNDVRVLQISSMKTWRGGEQQVAYLTQELKKRGKKPIMVVPRKSELEKFCRDHDIQYYTLKFNNGYNLYSAWRLKIICQRNQIDILHMQCSASHTLSVFSHLMGNPAKLVLSRRVDFPIRSNKFSKLKYNYKGILQILTVSNKIKEVISPVIAQSEKIRTVYSGIDLNKFSENGEKTLRSEYQIPPDQFLIGNVAAIANHKDYFTFVDTAELVLKQGIKATFMIIGDDGGEKKDIEAYIKSKNLEDHIIMTGFRRDVPKILPQLDIFLFTSKEEGLGTSVLDALAAGVPVIATKAGGVPEMIKNLENGLLCEIQRPDELAKAVEYMIEQPEEKARMVANGLEIVKKFSKESTADQTLEVYESLV